MFTTWFAENSDDWVMTRRPAPLCMGCKGEEKEIRRDETTITVGTTMPEMKLNLNADIATCPVCGKKMIKQEVM